MSRYLAIDYGEKRIGLAMSDPLKMFASPYKILENKGMDQLILDLNYIIEENDINKIILGLPLNMNGSHGFQADIVMEVFCLIKSKIKIKIDLIDERESSVKARKLMKVLKIKDKAIDDRAASFFLQEYLDIYN